MKISPDELAAALTVLAEVVAEKVAERLTANDGADLFDQQSAPVPARTFCALARARLTRGAGGVFRKGRLWLMSSAALTEEMELRERARKAKASCEAKSPTTAAGALEAELDGSRGLHVLRGGKK